MDHRLNDDRTDEQNSRRLVPDEAPDPVETRRAILVGDRQSGAGPARRDPGQQRIALRGRSGQRDGRRRERNRCKERRWQQHPAHLLTEDCQLDASET